MSVEEEHVAAAARYVQHAWSRSPQAAVVLGSGLGGWADSLRREVILPYGEIPHFPTTTALGHAGRLVGGLCGEIPVIAMEGRFHRYEGFSRQQLIFPIRVLHALGIRLLILSNASGGVHPSLQVGDLVVISDHIDWLWLADTLPLDPRTLGEAIDRQDAQCSRRTPYDPTWIERAQQLGRQQQVAVRTGVYAAMTGPCYETRAEYRWLRRCGADVVGMSTIPEAQTAAALNVPVLALSIVANVCHPEGLQPTSGEAVLRAAAAAEPRLALLIHGLLEMLGAGPCESATTDGSQAYQPSSNSSILES